MPLNGLEGGFARCSKGWYRAQQALGVSMARASIELFDRRSLHNTASIHHHHLVAMSGDNAKIMGNENGCHAHLRLQLLDQLKNLRLHGDIQSGGWLVCNEQVRLASKSNGNDHPLTHTARELVRILHDALFRSWNTYSLQ